MYIEEDFLERVLLMLRAQQKSLEHEDIAAASKAAAVLIAEIEKRLSRGKT